MKSRAERSSGRWPTERHTDELVFAVVIRMQCHCAPCCALSEHGSICTARMADISAAPRHRCAAPCRSYHRHTRSTGWQRLAVPLPLLRCARSPYSCPDGALTWTIRTGLARNFERGYAQRWGLPALSDRVRLDAKACARCPQLSPIARVVDIGCGHGRHAIALSERGTEVIGLDFAVALLNRARQLATEHRSAVRWIRGDMRQLPFRSRCAAAAMVMDAFGFSRQRKRTSHLREVARVLTTGGGLGLKVVNGRPVLGDFREPDRRNVMEQRSRFIAR